MLELESIKVGFQRLPWNVFYFVGSIRLTLHTRNLNLDFYFGRLTVPNCLISNTEVVRDRIGRRLPGLLGKRNAEWIHLVVCERKSAVFS